MKSKLVLATALLALAAGSTAVEAGNMVYTPINPSFGGNPMNSSHLLGLASAQRQATAADADSDDPIDPTDPTGGGDSDADLFVRQLQGRLLSALASQVTEAIFGENPQDKGTITFDTTIISFERTATSIVLQIYDADTGTTTTIEVPQLVSN